MLLYILLILGIIGVLGTLGALREGMDSKGGRKQLFPFANPFNPAFFHKEKRLYKTGTTYSESVKKIISDSVVSYLKDGKDGIDRLDTYDLDFVVDTELNIATNYSKGQKNNVRFVCSMYASSLLLIAPNDTNIIDIGDIKHYTCKVTIVVNPSSYHALVKLLSVFELRDKVLIQTVSSVQTETTWPRFPFIYATYVTYGDPGMKVDPLVRRLTESVPSHLVSMRKVNSGSYFVTYQEQPFYKQHPYFYKSMIDIIQLQRQYPLLSQVHNRDLYYPTIRMHYVLLCHNKVSNDKIQNVVRTVLRRTVTLTAADISHMTVAIPMHEGAKEVFRNIQLHTVPGGVQSKYAY